MIDYSKVDIQTSKHSSNTNNSSIDSITNNSHSNNTNIDNVDNVCRIEGEKRVVKSAWKEGQSGNIDGRPALRVKRPEIHELRRALSYAKRQKGISFLQDYVLKAYSDSPRAVALFKKMFPDQVIPFVAMNGATNNYNFNITWERITPSITQEQANSRENEVSDAEITPKTSQDKSL